MNNVILKKSAKVVILRRTAKKWVENLEDKGKKPISAFF
jgi:hypothetical protein